MTHKYNTTTTDGPVKEAAEWFIRLHDENLSEADYMEWQEWLAASAANSKAFAKAESCWNKMDDLTDIPWPRDKKSPVKTLLRLFPSLTIISSLAATILIALSLSIFIQDSSLSPLTVTTYQTSRAEHKHISLKDGSSITLGARSIINVNYNKTSRRITLVRGEAVFNVAKNKDRPFIVNVGKGSVTAIGTKFNIHSNNKDVTVTVLEGIVQVNPYLAQENPKKTSNPMVPAGKSVSYHDDGLISKVITTNVEAAVSWEKGLLVRIDTPLANVIEDVNRYSTREIIIGDPALNQISFTGTILNEGIDNWLHGLSIAYPIKVLDSGHNAILLLKKEE